MTSSPVRSALWCVPVAHKSVFRLEVQVTGSPTATGTHKLEYMRCGEKWIMEVKYSNVCGSCGFAINLGAPESAKTFTHRPYMRTNDKDIFYTTPGSWMNKNGTFIVGAEVTMESSALPTSSWNFASSEQMENWDVVLCVGDMKFYAHKTILSFASPTFRSMFEREFREKNQQAIPVSVPGTNARHFEAFLQCLYPGGSEPNAEFIVPLVTLADFYNVKPVIDKCVGMLMVLPNVSNVDKLRVAIKVNSTSLEDVVIASLSRADIDELIAAGFKDLGDERWQKIVAKCHSMIP